MEITAAKIQEERTILLHVYITNVDDCIKKISVFKNPAHLK